VDDALAALSFTLHKCKLRFDNARSNRCPVAAAVFRLHFDAYGHPLVVHYADTESVRHIALSARGP
jgi:hypothetical protein